MKKYVLACIMAIILIIAGCSDQKADKERKNINTVHSNQKIHEEETKNTNQITPIMDHADQWSKIILKYNKLKADLNDDGEKDDIKILYEEREGSKYMKKFSLILSNVKRPFFIEDYDASFEKLELFDIDQDGNREILLLFDTHGAGGNGTHDFYILKYDAEGFRTKVINTVDGISVHRKETWNMDGIYDIEKVEYKKEAEKLLVRQYVYGANGHVDEIGDMVSIVYLDYKSGLLKSEHSWLETSE